MQPEPSVSELQHRIQLRKQSQLAFEKQKEQKIEQSQKQPGADRAFYILTRENPLRKLCLRIATSKLFDFLIILAIIANSVILGLTDFSVVVGKGNLNPASDGVQYVNGKVVKAWSTRNRIVELSELPFTSLFAFECVVKVIALGFVQGRGTYLRDTWNVLDFFVVTTSLISILPTVPNVSAIRTIRVLRPLRSLSVIPGMRKLISSLLKALPALANVLILQLFVFAIFGILGIQLFGGNMNRRCRLTEFPVRMPTDNATGAPVWPIPQDYLNAVLDDPILYMCLPGAPILDDGDPAIGKHTKETSPWNTPQSCFWPIDNDDKLLCSVPSVSGKHHCPINRTCGSDFDTYGNGRFTHTRVMDMALYSTSFNWGYTNFDNIGRAFFTIFQSITQEGWTPIMYMAEDSGTPLVAQLFFLILIIFASFFVMNLTLAVISEEFNIDEEPDELSDSARAEERAKQAAAEAKQLARVQRQQARHPWLFKIVSHPVFSGFIMLVILANTTVLALDHHPMPPSLDANLEIVNFGLSCVFLLEMLLKLVGLGLRQYVRDRFNVFDAFVVTMSVLETIATPPSFLSSATAPKKGAVSALRSFRLFRVFKLARDWRSLRELLAMIIRAVASIANFGVLLFLFIYIYALVGLQFFANSMRFDNDNYPIAATDAGFWEGQVPRNNFDTMLWSVITVFQVITGENWNNIMYDAIRGNGMVASIYFISLVMFGDFILMNLFLALLLDNFGGGDEAEAKEKQEEMKHLAQKMSTMKVFPIDKRKSTRDVQKRLETIPSHGQLTVRSVRNHEVVDELNGEEVKTIDLDQLTKELAQELSMPPAKDESVAPTTPGGILKLPREKRTGQREPTQSLQRASEKSSTGRAAASRTAPANSPPQATRSEDEQSAVSASFQSGPPPGRLFFLFPETNRFRRKAYAIIAHPWFDHLILTLIIASSISLALDNPLENPKGSLPRFLKRLDNGFAIVFLLEMVLKIIALGVVYSKGSYLRNSWNILDCIIVVSSIVMLVAESTKGGVRLNSLKSLRGLRTFRPLRMISRRPGLKLVVNALIEAIPEVLNVLFVCMLFFLIFSIVAVNYLKGTFYHCSGDVFDRLSAPQQDFLTHPRPWSSLGATEQGWFTNTTCVGFATLVGTRVTSRYVCECWGAEWGEVLPENFNNVGHAMLTFFELSTTEGWADVMMAAMDSTDIDMQPIRDNTEAWSYFFIAFIMVGSFFVVNLFVGVIIDNFNRMKAALGGDFLLTEEQKKWIETQKTASRVGPIRKTVRPKSRFRGRVFDLVKRKRFEWFIMLCIIVNTILMGIQYYGQPTNMIETINNINEVFAVVFTLEAVLKIIAYGSTYLVDPWNKFDFFVVVGTLSSILVEAFTGASVRSLAMLVRVFRVTRIIRLIKASKSIRQILLTLYIALPGLSNITSILFLMLFIYATMGVQMFAKVAFTSNVDSHANFQGFWTAFLFLMRAATGEAWNSCMHDYASSPPGCVEDPPYNDTMCGFNDVDGCVPINGCGNGIAYVYFCSFTLLVTYVMLNLTIAVILEGFSLSHEDEEPLFEPELLEEFQNKWADIDKTATGFISVTKIRLLITILDAPLGRAEILMDKGAFIRYMHDLRLPMYEGNKIHFKDVLLAMAREMVKETVANDPNALSDLPPPTEDVPDLLPLEFEAHQYFAICSIQRSVAEWLSIKRELERRTMEEYKNKIKKPSGRPKKVRDARVYTIS